MAYYSIPMLAKSRNYKMCFRKEVSFFLSELHNVIELYPKAMDLVLITMTRRAHKFPKFGPEVRFLSKQLSGVNSDPRQIIN